MVTLFLIINRHYFEYHYAWNYSSKLLPVYYQVSSFWNGQEGSFLLWTFWNVILGLVLLHTNKFWRPSVMTVMSVTQIFLTSMVIGVVIFNVKIGSSPFLLLRDVIDDSIFKINPEFVPADGNGLNPLLQNYWMVIHPPTLFLGFASTVVPFAYAIAGLWQKKYKEWVRPALPWAQFSAMILGLGILMGAYWAYETLNFGGYWNWDPVENAIYVPWLTLVAGIHTMIAYKKNSSALKASMILIVATYVLILYSTFLTRSGVLGESSVHSFTDLGLQGQLLIFLFAFLIFSIFLMARHWNKMPASTDEVSTYSREFWIFMGATVLSLMAFQVIIPTSIPVFNEIGRLFGFDPSLAPPADQVIFYTKFQLWFAIALAILSGTGQFFWWNKMDKEKLKAELKMPIVLAMLISAVIIVWGLAKPLESTEEILQFAGFILLLFASVYSIVANLKILLSLKKTNLKLSGGSITHIGVALMLVGILFSSGYSKILSKNNTGMVWSKEFPDEVNQNNLLLFLNEPRPMGDYSMIYRGIRRKTKELGYVDANKLEPTENPLKLRVKFPIEKNGEIVAERGELVTLYNHENSYFEVLYQKESGTTFTLYPRVQMNEAMGVVYSPDINRTLKADLYTHVRTFPDPEQETSWSETQEITVEVGDNFFINDYVATFKEIVRIEDVDNLDLGPGDVAVKAIIEIQGEYDNYLAEPVYIIKDRMAGRLPETVTDVAAQITIQSIQPENNSFTFGIKTTQKDWIIMEAVEKPLINILWIGTLLLVIGFIVAIIRRYEEFKTFRNKGLEA
jgi:cytochrome c-type biogenesis protein CcmF